MTSEPITTKGYCAMQTQIKVRGYHLDVYQHVNNARYLEFLEEARWDGLENSESFQWLTAHNIAFVVVNININYRRPAVLGDVLTVTSEVQQLNGKSGVLSQVVTLEPEGQIVADALITDEASAMEWSGQAPRLVEGRSDNIKVTRPEDLEWLKLRWANRR